MANRKILDAARRVFARKGLGATISDIAEEAGVSQGLAYRYFSSKEAIFHTILRELMKSGEVRKWAEASGGPRERLERFLSETIRLRREHPEFYQFLFQALSEETLPKDIRQMISDQGQEIRRALKRLIVEGQAKGEVAAGDPVQLVDVILACLEGLSMRIAYPGPRETKIPDSRIILRLLGTDRSKEHGVG